MTTSFGATKYVLAAIRAYLLQQEIDRPNLLSLLGHSHQLADVHHAE
jgi:hypothetical protein